VSSSSSIPSRTRTRTTTAQGVGNATAIEFGLRHRLATVNGVLSCRAKWYAYDKEFDIDRVNSDFTIELDDNDTYKVQLVETANSDKFYIQLENKDFYKVQLVELWVEEKVLL
jgi:hypothetical protein